MAGDLFSGIAQTVTGLTDSALTFIGNKKAREQNERLLREQWARDDTAVQRRVQDLEAAGLNKVLAAGSAADTSSAPMSVKSDYQSGSLSQIGGNIAQALELKDRLATSDMQRALLKAQALKYNADTEATHIETQLKNEQVLKSIYEREHNYAGLREVEARIKKLGVEMDNSLLARSGIIQDNKLKALSYDRSKYDFDYYKSRGLRSSGPDSKWTGLVLDIFDVGSKALAYF